MDAALATLEADAAPLEAALAGFAAPPLHDLPPFTRMEIEVLFRGGEPEADACEHLLAWGARRQGALDVALAEGLAALKRGDRLAELGCHLDDYAREALDLGKRTAENLARLGAELRTRPLLREALRSGRVRLRAAETVAPVAVGEAEAVWVERAATQTVRELEAAVRAGRGQRPEDEEEEWVRLHVRLQGDERLLLDEALAIARRQLPGSTRVEQLEALAQEYLAEFSMDAVSDGAPLGPGFRARGGGPGPRRPPPEGEPEAQALLSPVLALAAPDVPFDEASTADEIDARLRAIARLRARWDRLVGACAFAVKRSGMHLRMGYGDFRHYVEERLGLPARAVEQRVALEARLARSPALQEAARAGVSYERLRVLARLPEADIAPRIPAALETTCVALKREVEGERERQMRARQELAVSLPRRVAVVLAAAMAIVRERHGHALTTGTCLTILAFHFMHTWEGVGRRSKTRSQRIRERDEGWCQVPGCSHRAAQTHHIEFRSQGGGNDAENQVGLCAYHHLRCIHGGYLAVRGQAPDALVWWLRGKAWTGPHRGGAGATDAAGSGPEGDGDATRH